MSEVRIDDFVIEAKFLPFLIDRDGVSTVDCTGYVDGKVLLSFTDGLKGSFKYEPTSEEVKKAINNKGYFVINPDTGEGELYEYTETAKVAKATTSRTGSCEKRNTSW